LWGIGEAFIGTRRRWVAYIMAGTKGDDRAERLKAALRENLKRRKAQARGRASRPGDEAPGEGPDQAMPDKALSAKDQAG
jgi:hypothetical protein